MESTSAKFSTEEVFSVAGQGALQFDVDFHVRGATCRFVGSTNVPKPSCDPDKSDFCAITYYGSVVTVSWNTFSKREILWQATGSLR